MTVHFSKVVLSAIVATCFMCLRAFSSRRSYKLSNHISLVIPLLPRQSLALLRVTLTFIVLFIALMNDGEAANRSYMVGNVASIALSDTAHVHASTFKITSRINYGKFLAACNTKKMFSVDRSANLAYGAISLLLNDNNGNLRRYDPDGFYYFIIVGTGACTLVPGSEDVLGITVQRASSPLKPVAPGDYITLGHAPGEQMFMLLTPMGWDPNSRFNDPIAPIAHKMSSSSNTTLGHLVAGISDDSCRLSYQETIDKWGTPRSQAGIRSMERSSNFLSFAIGKLNLLTLAQSFHRSFDCAGDKPIVPFRPQLYGESIAGDLGVAIWKNSTGKFHMYRFYRINGRWLADFFVGEVW